MENLTTEQIKQLTVEEQLNYRLARRGLRLASAGNGEPGWYARVTTWYEGEWAAEQYWVTDLEVEQLPEVDMDGLAFPSPDPTEEERAAFERWQEDSQELARALGESDVFAALYRLAQQPKYGWRRVTHYLDKVVILFNHDNTVIVEVHMQKGAISRIDTLLHSTIRLSVPGGHVSGIPRADEALDIAWAYEDEAARDRSGSYPHNQ